MVEQVQQSVRLVPLPVVSVLLAGRRMLTSDSLHSMQLSVRLLASISLSIHHDEVTANLCGQHGPSGQRGC